MIINLQKLLGILKKLKLNNASLKMIELVN
jgi:hypothetical protein